MEKKKNDIIGIFNNICDIIGNPILSNIFDKYKNDEEELYNNLKNYLKGIYEYEEGEEKINFKYLSIKDSIIDISNISRIESKSEYNTVKKKIIYYIKIIKKFPSPLEEDYNIYFDSEEERNKGFELLKIKLKLCDINIV